MTSYRTTNDIICAKNALWFWSTYITHINSSIYYEETFHVNSSSQTMQNTYLKFMVGKLSLQEIATLAIIWEKSGDWEMFSKIWRSWSLTDYPGELTALIVLFPHPAIVPPVPLPQISLLCKPCTRTIFKMHVWDLANKNCWEYWIEGTFCQDDEIEKQTIHVHSNLY